ncbi:MAG: hypothetical protein RL641_30 [Candidatus Parcubacteria bacterium]|jgi:hypothetical protein
MSKPKAKNQEKSATIATGFDVNTLVMKGVSAHSNMNQRVVTLPENTIRICLMNNMKNLEDRRAWQTPFGILIAILIIFPTAEFKDWIFPKATWQAVFFIAALICVGWLIQTLWVRPKKVTIDQIIEELIPPGTEIKGSKKRSSNQ